MRKRNSYMKTKKLQKFVTMYNTNHSSTNSTRALLQTPATQYLHCVIYLWSSEHCQD